MRRNACLWRVCALIVSLCLLPSAAAGCKSADLHAYSATYFDETFDTVLSVTVGAKNAEEADTYCRAIKSLVSDLHKQFHAYETYDGIHNLATVNAAESGTPVTVSEDLMALLKLGQEVYRVTEGAVHIGMGALTSLWKNAISTASLPSDEDIARAISASPALDAMVLDDRAGTVTLMVPGMKLDAGAIAKGYVLERVRAYAAEVGIQSLLCNLGGEILAIGSAPDGEDWEVAIADPDGGTLERVRVKDAVVATGGDYERGFTVGGKRYHHVIDPATGYPADSYRAATVILPLESAAPSDAYSTALMILSAEEGEAFAEKISGLAYLRVPHGAPPETNAAWH